MVPCLADDFWRAEVMELETCGGLSVANATEPVLVLGAAGGAGSMAVALLASQGYKVRHWWDMGIWCHLDSKSRAPPFFQADGL
jgi:hypothetical protein